MAQREAKIPSTSTGAYKKVITAFRARKKGATPADIAAATGLPLYTVRELVPKAADEYSGRLEVTESGEILYSFPGGFTSRYRGLGPFAKRTMDRLGRALVSIGAFVFKAWIMVMLIGYFLLLWPLPWPAFSFLWPPVHPAKVPAGAETSTSALAFLTSYSGSGFILK